jgi:hypothetical protein
VVFLKGIFDTLLVILNHFPLFALMLRFKDPHRIPGSIYFVPCQPESVDKSWYSYMVGRKRIDHGDNGTYYYLKVPLPFIVERSY